MTKKKSTEELPEMELVELVEPKAKPKVVPRRIATRTPKLVSFDVWAKKRGIKEHHKGGMKAFVKNPNQPRTEDVWDKLFTDY